MSKLRDDPDSVATEQTRPLNARSLALSVLLGTHPPSLSARALVDVAQVFGIHAGTMRTALSRMAAAGDITAEGGRYSLSPRLVQRQAAQDAGRHRVDHPWDGTWHTAVATVDHRELADRRRLRSEMGNARFGELRPSVWLRPANLPAPRLGDDWLVTTGSARGTPADDLARRLWNLPELAATAAALEDAVDTMLSTLDVADPASLPPAFSLAADVVRYLRTEPLLPAELTPPDWPVDALRRSYDRLEAEVQAMLRPILIEPS